MNTNQLYTIEKITTEDARLIKQFLNEYFYKDSPLSEYVKMNDEDCSVGRNCTINGILDGCSFKAIKPNGEIIGLILNRYINKSDHENVDTNKNHIALRECKNEKVETILRYVQYIEMQVNVFDLYADVDRILYMDILSVNPSYRNSGIGRTLIMESLRLMAAEGITVCEILVTNYFLSKLCEKLGFDELFQLPFDEYVINGIRPLLPKAPHNVGKIFAKRI